MPCCCNYKPDARSGAARPERDPNDEAAAAARRPRREHRRSLVEEPMSAAIKYALDNGHRETNLQGPPLGPPLDPLLLLLLLFPATLYEEAGRHAARRRVRERGKSAAAVPRLAIEAINTRPLPIQHTTRRIRCTAIGHSAAWLLLLLLLPRSSRLAHPGQQSAQCKLHTVKRATMLQVSSGTTSSSVWRRLRRAARRDADQSAQHFTGRAPPKAPETHGAAAPTVQPSRGLQTPGRGDGPPCSPLAPRITASHSLPDEVSDEYRAT